MATNAMDRRKSGQIKVEKEYDKSEDYEDGKLIDKKQKKLKEFLGEE